jgi:hypothetical protein
MKIFLLIFISIILVTSVTLAINHPSFGYGGGGSGGGRILDPRVCGDKLCSEIPGGRSAWEAKNEATEQESKKISLHLSPRQQVKNGIERDQVICKEGLILFIKYNGSPACLRHDTAVILEERGWGGMPPTPVQPSLLECSRVPDNQIECSEGFVCYEELSGGLGPTGALPIESIGGDKKCHKECVTDNDCPSNSPNCVLTKILTEDYIEAFYLCFSKESPEIKIDSFEDCVAAGNLVMESHPRQCRTSDGKHFVEFIIEFSLSYSKEGGFAGITQNISIDTQDNLIIISGFNSKTLGPISTEDMQHLWDIISDNQFFELDSTIYPPVEGSADYFTYTLDVVSSLQRNTISWTDTSSEFPKELVIITQEIDRQIQFYSENS